MKKREKKEKHAIPTIGWREFIGLPELGVCSIKAKIDTGARSSSLHAFDLIPFEKGGKPWVNFKIHPHQRNSHDEITVEVPVLTHRSVRSSNGRSSIRPVIITPVFLFGRVWDIEVTLADRDEMGFRMLLGREAVRGRYLVDAGRSYYGGKPTK